MGEKMEKYYNLIRGRGYTSEEQVREYFKKRNILAVELIDAIVEKLVRDGIVNNKTGSPVRNGETVPIGTEKSVPKPADSPPAGREEKEKARPVGGFFIPAYQKALAQFFSSHSPMPAGKMKFEMSFKMNWFTPADAEMFIGFCKRDGLLVEDGGVMKPTFDASAIVVPEDWTIHSELGIKDGREIANRKAEEMEHKKEQSFVNAQQRAESSKFVTEEGLDDGGLIFSETAKVDDCRKARNDFKAKVASRLTSCNVPLKTAKNMFDYFELNFGLTDLEMFKMMAIQQEGFADENAIKKAYDVLLTEKWFS